MATGRQHCGPGRLTERRAEPPRPGAGSHERVNCRVEVGLDPPRRAKEVMAVATRVCRHLTAGDIVLLHDTDRYSPPGSSRRALDALGPIASDLHQKALRAVTLEQLVGAGGS